MRVLGISVCWPTALICGPHKSFSKLNLLVKVQWLWSCVHYFQWFTGCLNDIDLLIPHVNYPNDPLNHANLHLSCFVDFILFPTDKYMFKVNDKKTWLICWMCSKLKVNTAWHRSGVFIVEFDDSLLTLNKYLSAV